MRNKHSAAFSGWKNYVRRNNGGNQEMLYFFRILTIRRKIKVIMTCLPPIAQMIKKMFVYPENFEYIHKPVPLPWDRTVLVDMTDIIDIILYPALTKSQAGFPKNTVFCKPIS